MEEGDHERGSHANTHPFQCPLTNPVMDGTSLSRSSLIFLGNLHSQRAYVSH